MNYEWWHLTGTTPQYPVILFNSTNRTRRTHYIVLLTNIFQWRDRGKNAKLVMYEKKTRTVDKLAVKHAVRTAHACILPSQILFILVRYLCWQTHVQCTAIYRMRRHICNKYLNVFGQTCSKDHLSNMAAIWWNTSCSLFSTHTRCSLLIAHEISLSCCIRPVDGNLKCAMQNSNAIVLPSQNGVNIH